MKRWLVVLLVLLALIVLISPGIVGRLAEKNLEENIGWAESESPGIEFHTESYERGWFSSEGRHRVVLSNPAFRTAAEEYRSETGYAELPSLVIDTRLDHGLVPIASLGREAGTLKPGLASTVSTFHIDPGNGELMPLPGALYSNVHLNGASDSRYLLEAGSQEYEDVRLEWEGADIAIHSDWSTGAVGVNGRIEPFSLSDNAETVRFGAISLTADQVRSDYGFSIGTAGFNMDSLVVENGMAPLTVGNVRVDTDANIENARLNVATKTTVESVSVPGLGEVDFAMDLAVNRLDARSVQVITQALRDVQASSDPDAALAGLFPSIEGDLKNIVASGTEVRIDRLDVALPQGTVSTRLRVDIPQSDAANFSWSGVLLAMTASADIRLPVNLYEYAQLMNPQAGSLVAMGILKQEGDDYVMKAEYAQGLLNVNGAPMPIPMPGM